jgi:hypothetical protein
MKRLSIPLALVALCELALVTGTQAHGLHPEVAPQYHVAVHVSILIGVAALAIGIGLWVRRRVRRQRTDALKQKLS